MPVLIWFAARSRRLHINVHPRPFRRVERQLRRPAELAGDVSAFLRRGLGGNAGRHCNDHGRGDNRRGAGERSLHLFRFPDFLALAPFALEAFAVDGEGSLSRLRHRYQQAMLRYGFQASPSCRRRSGVGRVRRP